MQRIPSRVCKDCTFGLRAGEVLEVGGEREAAEVMMNKLLGTNGAKLYH